jgi:hypothetical protein
MIHSYCPLLEGQGYTLPLTGGPPNSTEVYAAVMDMHSKDRSVLYTDPLYVAQDLVLFEYFPKDAPPRLVDVGHAQDLIREMEAL